MALVTVQRSPTPSATSSPCASEADSGEDDGRFQPRSISESFLTVKGAALFLPHGNGSSTPRISHRRNKHAGDLQQHLQAMFTLLRPEDNIRLAVRLESMYQNRTRYMVVVSTNGRQDTEENIVLGMDFSSNDSSVCTMGLVLPLWSDALIHLDGDGGFSVSTDNRIHIFKPVSVQAMWSALQSLHKACEVARSHNYYPGSLFLTWVSYYESHLNSDQSSVNEWNAMQDVQSHRPDSPTLFTDVPTELERTERLIRTKLREIMMQKDLENITSKEIRTELEMQMACNLRKFKEFIDNEMIVILGQMDSPTQIFEHVFLGSEWNASNLEDLQHRGVRYILNVTREIDNFFPGVFEYHNIRVYDEEATDLLAYWNDTYKFISKAKKNGAKCLVHCKMGVSRSASTVIAYAMKEYGWNLDRAYDYVKERRTVTKPNPSFMRQLEEYQGILLASKQRHNKLWRSHSDSDLSDHHEPMGKSGMEVSKKEITTSADQISDNKTSNGHPLSASPGLPPGPPKEHLCHSSPGALGRLCHPERVIRLEMAPRDYRAEQLEDALNLNHLNGCHAGCPLDEAGFPPGSSDPETDPLLPPQGETFSDLTVDELEKDALKPGDGSVHLVPMEELASCLRDLSGRTSPSLPPPAAAASAAATAAPQPAEADFAADRIDFFSALEKFVELSQDSRPRACSHSRTEEHGGSGGIRNSLSKGPVLELSPSELSAEDAPHNSSSSARNSPLGSEDSSLEEEQQVKLSEPDRPSGLTRSHSENAVSVKEIVTEIESIHHGSGQGQGQARADPSNAPAPTPKRSTVHELPPESISAWETKLGRTEHTDGGGSGCAPKETNREPSRLGQEAGLVLPEPPEADEAGDSTGDPAESHGTPRPKWCPGSVRRATLEFEERLRQEQEAPHAAPGAALPLRKNSRNNSPASDLASAKGKNDEAAHEPAPLPTEKEASRARRARTENGTDPPAPKPPLSHRTSPEHEKRTAAAAASSGGGQEKLPAPERQLLLLPKRIEIIEYTHAVRPPAFSATTTSRDGTRDSGRGENPGVAVDENCNAATWAESSGDARKALFSLGSPDEEEEEEEKGRRSALPAAPSVPASWARRSPPPARSDRQPVFCLEGVTQESTSSDPQPAAAHPEGVCPGRSGLAFEERGGLSRPRSEGTLAHWNREDLGVPETLRRETAGPLPPEAAAPSPLPCGLLHRSSIGSLRDLSGTSGVVKRHAQELDARIRQAGLTPPSLMKRSASLAKLDRLDLSKEDLGRTEVEASPSTGRRAARASLRAPGGHLREPGTQGPAAAPLAPGLPSPLPWAPRPAAHLVEQVKLAESIALSKPVERPPVQYAQDFNPARKPLLEAELTHPLAGRLPSGSQWLAVLPRYPHSRTRLPRRLKKANDRKRTANPLYNTM